MNATFKGRKVEGICLGDVDPKDHPDYCDAFIEEATWVDTGEELTEEECLELQEHCVDQMHQWAFESQL